MAQPQVARHRNLVLNDLGKTLFAVTGAALLLLFVGIRNALDAVTYDISVNHLWRRATLAKIHSVPLDNESVSMAGCR